MCWRESYSPVSAEERCIIPNKYLYNYKYRLNFSEQIVTNVQTYLERKISRTRRRDRHSQSYLRLLNLERDIEKRNSKQI